MPKGDREQEIANKEAKKRMGKNIADSTNTTRKLTDKEKKFHKELEREERRGR